MMLLVFVFETGRSHSTHMWAMGLLVLLGFCGLKGRKMRICHLKIIEIMNMYS